jgi:hypothetical protein
MSNVVTIREPDATAVMLLEKALERARAGLVLNVAIAEYGPAPNTQQRQVRVSLHNPDNDTTAILAMTGGLAKLQAVCLEDVETT